MRPVLSNVVAANALGVLLAFTPVAAMEAGRGDFAFVSELAADGFEPFAASGVAKSLFGMKKGDDMFLCFLADSKTLQVQRQETCCSPTFKAARKNAPCPTSRSSACSSGSGEDAARAQYE